MSSPTETQAQAHFLALWGSLLSAGISESKIYEILSKEAGHPTLKVLANSLKEEAEDAPSLSSFFEDAIHNALIVPWVQSLLFQCEDGEGDCEALGDALVEAASILKDEALGRQRSLFWRKVQVLHQQKLPDEDILETLAKDAQRAGDEDFAETLYVATRLCRNGKSLAAALAKSAKTFLRSEKILLASTIGTDELSPTLERLTFLAKLASPPEARAQATPTQHPEAQSQSLGETSAKVKKTISGALSSVGDRVGDFLGLNPEKEEEISPQEATRITPRSPQAQNPAPVNVHLEERREERRRRAEQALGASKAPVIRVNIKKNDDDKGSSNPKSASDSSTQLRAVQKTIGPAWMNDDGSINEAARSESTQNPKKTIGLGQAPQETPPRPAVKVTIARKEEPVPEIHGPVTIDKLRSYLLLLQDSPQHTIIAEQVAEGIAKLRKDLGDDYDPDLEASRRELDDLELAFGTWKAQHGR